MTPIWFAWLTFTVRIHEDPTYQDHLKWVANFFVFSGAIALAFSADWAATIWPFIFYTIGNLLWIYVAVEIMRDKPLIWLNLFFLGINAIGILTRA